MSGRITHAALRALDRVNRALLPKSKKAEHLQTGRRGEEDAYFYLRKLGYVMVARNWRSPRRKGELDLVGWDGHVLCFVEVKTRTTMDVVPAEAAVDAEKRAELSAMAREYLRLLNQQKRPVEGEGKRQKEEGKKQEPWDAVRFDVLSIYYLEDGAKRPQFTLFKNCFPMA